MTDTLRIKRRSTAGAAGAPSSLAAAEIAYNEKDHMCSTTAGATTQARCDQRHSNWRPRHAFARGDPRRRYTHPGGAPDGSLLAGERHRHFLFQIQRWFVLAVDSGLSKIIRVTAWRWTFLPHRHSARLIRSRQLLDCRSIRGTVRSGLRLARRSGGSGMMHCFGARTGHAPCRS